MGTTTRSLRYPEATVLANTLHTQIKNLADDVTTQLNAVKVEIVGRELVQQLHGGGTFSNSGSDFPFGLYTLTIPSGTEIIDLFASGNASAAANGACYWYLQCRPASGLWFNVDSSRCHNNAVPATNLSPQLWGSTTPAELGSPATFQVRLVVNVDAGGSAVSAGPFHLNAVYKRVN